MNKLLIDDSEFRHPLYGPELMPFTQVLKGGPGSGRYPKGSGGSESARDPPMSLLATMDQADGGFTYSPTTGEQPTTGFALSVHPDREQVIESSAANAVELAKYVVKNWDLLSQDGNFVGGWHHPTNGKVYLDVSTVVATAKEADKLARDAHQIAYFDLVNGVSIKTPEYAYAKAAHDPASGRPEERSTDVGRYSRALKGPYGT